ncbi:hypothetical protein [Trueperella pyogenes]
MSLISNLRRGAACLAAVALFVPASTMAYAQATPNHAEDQITHRLPIFTEDERASLINEFVYYGVDDEVATKLLDKLQNGYPLDSMRPEAVPTSTTSHARGTEIEVVRTYADGSIAVGTTPDFERIKNSSIGDGPQLRSVSGCTYSSGGAYAGYWRNCVASENLIVVRMGFTFDYETIRDRGSRITGYRSYFHHIVGGSLSNFRFDRMSPTQVRLSADFDFSFKEFPLGWTAWMQVNVSGSQAWTTHN